MEVVLSPGRFGEEASGAPFQNEEIREWSHVDRLTGILERARVETGRWQTSNQGAARSYGKVTDSRERNSADGSIVQRARRQVEVFQSQAPGRSVQVVRASHWSSSRVTETATNGTALASAAQSRKEEKPEDRFANLCGLSAPTSSVRRDEAMSERLSSLLGSFAYPASSTVPLRRIDSRYSSRTPISLTSSKRFSSDENVSIHDETRVDLSSTAITPRESEPRRRDSREVAAITERENFSQRTEDRRRGSDPEEVANVRVLGSGVELEETQRRLPVREVEEISVEKNCQAAKTFEETRPAASRAKAIHLLPSSKANTTVVNLMNDADSQPWLLTSSTRVANETRSRETKLGGDATRGRYDDSSIVPLGRVKRVGFCKTEIHFAADSGKVNIVETDGKPPPTNKFRRRRRNGICEKVATSLSNEADLNDETTTRESKKADETIEDKTKNDPNLHRGHTTTVNLGTDFDGKSDRSERGEASRIVPLDSSEETTGASTSLPSALPAGSSSKPEGDPTTEDYDVLCTDADNNRVLLKVVTTHEPTLARVESDHLRRKTTPGNSLPTVARTERPSTKVKTPKTDVPSEEHTYVNVFTGSKRAPIYENYKIADVDPKHKGKTCPRTSTETKIPPENIYVDRKIRNCGSSARTKESEDEKVDKIKRIVEGKANSRAEETSNGSKQVRSGPKETKPTVKGKSTRPEASSSSTTNRGTAGVRCSRNDSPKGPGSRRSSTRAQEESVASSRSSERGLRTSGASSSVGKANGSKPTRDMVASTQMVKRNEGSARQKPMEVVYQTAVYNMKNERLSRPQKGKESKGPRYLNELICGAKTKRAGDSKNKTSSTNQNAADKGALKAIRHWK